MFDFCALFAVTFCFACTDCEDGIMKESSIRALAVIALLTCTVFLMVSIFFTSGFDGSQNYYDEIVKPTGEGIDHPAFITFFPSS